MPYTKSIVSAVLTGLVMVRAPVFDEGDEGKEKSEGWPRQLRILCVGFGGGSIPSFFVEMLPKCHVDVVELEPAVIQASSDAGFQEDHRIQVIVQDGAAFALDAVARGSGYDALIIDAYDADGNVPTSFTTESSAFLEAASAVLMVARVAWWFSIVQHGPCNMQIIQIVYAFYVDMCHDQKY